MMFTAMMIVQFLNSMLFCCRLVFFSSNGRCKNFTMFGNYLMVLRNSTFFSLQSWLTFVLFCVKNVLWSCFHIFFFSSVYRLFALRLKLFKQNEEKHKTTETESIDLWWLLFSTVFNGISILHNL